MDKDKTPKEEKFQIDGQWFVRGNRSSAWLSLASRLDGSASGIAEKIPSDVWPILDHVATLTARCAELTQQLGVSAAGRFQSDARIADLERQLASAQRATIERCAKGLAEIDIRSIVDFADESWKGSAKWNAASLMREMCVKFLRALHITDPSAQNSGEEG